MPATATHRILVDARVGWGSGIGRYIENVVPRVARLLPDMAFEALVTEPHAERARHCFADAGNIRVIPTTIEPFSVAEQVRLARHAQGCDLTWFTNYWIPLAWRGRFAVTVHDVIHLLPDLFPAPRVKRLASHYTFAKIRRQADLVLFDSRFTRDEFHRLVGRPENGIVVQLGGDHMNRGRSPIVAKEKSLLVVAAFKKHKNFATVLDAWRRAQVAGHWRLTIIAPDEKLRSSVDVEAMTAGIHGVDLRRSVSDAELHDIYGRTAILLAPSLYEGFGLPLLEAFSAGAFAISSTAGSLVEIADGAEAAMVNGSDIDGWVAAIERTCARFDDHDFDALGIARRNMAHAASFRWSDTASGTAAALRGLLDPIPSPSDTGFPSDHV